MDKDIMLYYLKLVEFLGVVLGPSYEIILYDLRRKDKSVIAIANSHVSGIRVGSPLTESALSSIENRDYEEIDYKANFKTSPQEAVLRSSILYIKDANDSLIGLMCINFDDTVFEDLSSRLMSLIHPDEILHKSSYEQLENINFSNLADRVTANIEEVSDKAIEEVLKGNSVPLDRLNRKEKIKFVKILDEKGIFMLKGAVPNVAKLLHCSEATIYRYLNHIKTSK